MLDGTNASTSTTSLQIKLKRELDARECQRRNALSQTSPGLVLSEGAVGTLLETFGGGEAFLVEFSKSESSRADACDWMGVLYPSEVEVRGPAR